VSLSKARVDIGQTAYAHEREAIEFVVGQLPNNDPYMLWGLVEVLEPATGRLYEIDLLVIGYSALYLVEIKSGPGTYEGNAFDWVRTPPDGPPRAMDAPYGLANHKAKVLASRLRAKIDDPPFVQPLVFLSAEGANVRLDEEGRTGVVTRRDVARALTHGEFHGNGGRQRERINAKQSKATADALYELGLRPRKAKLLVGDWQLGGLLGEGPGYQDFEATHRTQGAFRRRARVYLVPQQTSVERKQQLKRAAEREAGVLYELREHPNVLAFHDFAEDAPLGPTVLFDAFEGGVRLDAFMRKHVDLGFGERIALIEQIGLALAFCHKQGVCHGALSPESVLVRRRGGAEGGKLEVKLFNFQLGWGGQVQGTVHRSSLVSEQAAAYLAPELRDDPSSGRPYSDVFGLGALAYFILTGTPPASTFVELDERLSRDHCLNPRVVDDSISADVADIVCMATQRSVLARVDDVSEWLEELLNKATAPEEPRPQVSPLEARPGEEVGGMGVVSVLGHGASSRVLEVERDGRHFALKVSLSEEHDRRLLAEAAALKGLRHPRIVELIDTLTLGGRACLLLTLAGKHTLYKRLADEGTLSLDAAARYGEDLLSALEYLEEQGITHRDIKPANVSVGAAGGPGERKEANRLTLFDFSLVESAPADLMMGTAAYRDPYLRERGSWDHHADLWSAAFTLHEMLTGVRPGFRDLPAAGADVVLAAERFDPSVREPLVAFFESALARDVRKRFANAEQMRLAWRRCLDVAAGAGPTSRSRPAAPSPVELSDAELARIEPGTPIEALPLKPLAKNALDRSGLTRVDDLLRLPENQLSAIRGIGAKVAKDILTFRNRWREARKAAEPGPPPPPFFASYRGDDLAVESAELEPPALNTLLDAGLPSLGTLAGAPEAQVRALAARNGFSAERLYELLERENKKANERAQPTTLEGWVDALLGKRKKAYSHVRPLYGLEGPFEGRLDVSVREAALGLGLTSAALYNALKKARELWHKHPAIDELGERCRHLVGAAGGALPLAKAADELAALLPHDREAPEALVRASAAALMRVAIELEHPQEGGLHLARLRGGEPWVLASADLAEPLRQLGTKADALASRPVLASPSEVLRALGEAVAGTSLAQLAPERLVELAAQASKGAARSARLELYPKGLEATRALELTAALLSGDLTPDDIRQRVRARYPLAEPLPERPALDALVEPLKLSWSELAQKYVRNDASPSTSLPSSLANTPRPPPVALSPDGAQSPEALTAQIFDQRLAAALESRALRVLGVRANLARRAALRLASRLGTEPVLLDKVLLDEIDALMAEKRIKPEAVDRADREGPVGPTWRNLATLTNLAAESLARKLLPPQKPLLLVQPGLLARYELKGFVQALVEASKRDDSAAIFLLVPGHDGPGGVPAINGTLALPGVLPSKALRVPSEWVNDHHHQTAGDMNGPRGDEEKGERATGDDRPEGAPRRKGVSRGRTPRTQSPR
jgi:serine/threonine protein kinase